MERQKKLRAAVGAVMAYLQGEEDARRAAGVPRPSDTPWCMHGRQTIMNNRAAWQRGVHRKNR